MKQAFLLVFLGLVLAGCTYTYVPLVPEIRTAEPRLDIHDSPGLSLEPEGLRLAVRLNAVPEAGWLAVQWYGPGNEELASDSLWISPQSERTVQTLYLPADISLENGLWRAVLSFEGQVLRQFTLELGSQESSAGSDEATQPSDDEDDDQQ